jgi:hypothetical protein
MVMGEVLQFFQHIGGINIKNIGRTSKNQQSNRGLNEKPPEFFITTKISRSFCKNIQILICIHI